MNLVFAGLMRVLAVLGFGFISYEGFDALISNMVRLMQGVWVGIGGNVLTLLHLAGFTDAIGYILAAISTKSLLVATKRFLPK